MKKTDLDSMCTDELWALHEKIASILSTRMETEKLKLEHRLEQIKSKTLDDIPERRAYPKIHPRFRNPDPPYQTWSGRGKQPRWLRELLIKGKSLDDFLIATK